MAVSDPKQTSLKVLLPTLVHYLPLIINPKVYTTFPEAMVTNCSPSTAKVIGAAWTLRPREMFHNSSPELASNAKK